MKLIAQSTLGSTTNSMLLLTMYRNYLGQSERSRMAYIIGEATAAVLGADTSLRAFVDWADNADSVRLGSIRGIPILKDTMLKATLPSGQVVLASLTDDDLRTAGMLGDRGPTVRVQPTTVNVERIEEVVEEGTKLLSVKQALAVEEIRKADGDAAEAAFWWQRMLTDPTARSTREANHYSPDVVWSERDAYKETYRLFSQVERLMAGS